MVAILKFDLSDPDTRVEHLRAVHAVDAFICIHDILEAFRQKEKYHGVDTMTIEEVRELIYANIPMEIQGLIHH